MREDDKEREESELLHTLDPTIARLPKNENNNPHKKTALELALRYVTPLPVSSSFFLSLSPFSYISRSLLSVCQANKLVSALVILSMFAFLALRITFGYMQGQIVSGITPSPPLLSSPLLFPSLLNLHFLFIFTISPPRFAWLFVPN